MMQSPSILGKPKIIYKVRALFNKNTFIHCTLEVTPEKDCGVFRVKRDRNISGCSLSLFGKSTLFSES